MRPDFKFYYTATVINTVCIGIKYQHNDRHEHQCNKIEGSEINTHIFDQSVLTRMPKQLNGGKYSIFNKGWNIIC